jgi:hypothetical protein
MGVELYTMSARSAAKSQIDTLVVPGGFLVEDVTRDRALVQWIAKISRLRRWSSCSSSISCRSKQERASSDIFNIHSEHS